MVQLVPAFTCLPPDALCLKCHVVPNFPYLCIGAPTSCKYIYYSFPNRHVSESFLTNQKQIFTTSVPRRAKQKIILARIDHFGARCVATSTIKPTFSRRIGDHCHPPLQVQCENQGGPASSISDRYHYPS